MNANENEIEPHLPQNKQRATSKLRRGGKYCPVCLAALIKNAARTRTVRYCATCQAHISADKSCRRCLAAAIWENKNQAACQKCGLHGSKSEVINGDS